MNAYTLMLRCLVRDARHQIEAIDDYRLDAHDVATVMRECPEMVGEALVSHEHELADALEEGTHGAWLALLLETRARRYILRDLQQMQYDVALEAAEHDTYEARCT